MANLKYVAGGQVHELPVHGAVSSVNGQTGVVTGLAEQSDVSAALQTKADKTVTVNGHPLSGNVTLDAQDVGAVEEPSAAGVSGQVLALASGGATQWVDPSGGITYTTQTFTIAASAWSDNSVTVNVEGVTATNLVQLSVPTKADMETYCQNGLFCASQGAGTLTFTCTIVPAVSVTISVVIWG